MPFLILKGAHWWMAGGGRGGSCPKPLTRLAAGSELEPRVPNVMAEAALGEVILGLLPLKGRHTRYPAICDPYQVLGEPQQSPPPKFF